ncbi:hypothetical protein LRAMOSA11194 [Lichtheimia ramosa]|uniref:TATA-binding protein interacting (TIP20) domain-containing protein n=1 Tax=Lichtheimia ramosa TaxID=688394 RepID=A0A077WUJ6_9FUNG|nr:hypothetical protein LRAMOSA11194 [Lichtheimia ramosa]
MSNDDRDFRYMALNDLINELEKNAVINIDEAIEHKVITAVLGLMRDNSGEVQNLAVKCLGPLVKRVRVENTLEIIDKLSDYAKQTDDEMLRGIASMGLKTVISEVDPSIGESICRRILPRLLEMVQSSSYEMQMDSLDILAEVLSRFGSQVTTEAQSRVQQVLMPLLDHPRAAVRKRTTVAIGYSVVHLTDDMYSTLMEHLLQGLKSTKSSEKLRTLIQCAGVLSRYSTKHLSGYLSQVMPIIVQHTVQADEDDELREICLQSLESFVVRCPTEITSYLNEIIKLGLEYIKYDPNYAEDDDDEEDEEMEEDEDDEFDDAVEYSDDDDDISWKVRRSATKLLSAVIETRLDLLEQLYENVAPALINRFKEREETVRIDVLQTFIILLRQTGLHERQDLIQLEETRRVNLYFDTTGFGEELCLLPEITPRAVTKPKQGPKLLLSQLVPNLTTALSKQLSSKSTQTRQAGFQLLRELLYVLQSGLDDRIQLFIPAIQGSLTAAGDQQQVALTSNLRIEVLAFLRQLFRTHEPASLYPFLDRLAPAVILTTSDRLYKIASEALVVCIELLKVIRPIQYNTETQQYDISPMNDQHMPYIHDIYQATLQIMTTSDADQEVKERSIMCFGALLSQTNDVLQSQQQEAWEMLLERLRNEVTRVITMRTLAIVCQSPVTVGEESKRCALVAVDELAMLLRKSNRNLRVASAQCLRILVKKFGESLSEQSYQNLVNEVVPLLSDDDLHLLPLALRLMETLVIVQPASAKQAKTTLLPTLLGLIQSPLLQGSALDSLLDLFAALGKADPQDYQELVQSLINPMLNAQTSGVSAGGVAAVANKQSAATVAQCVAVLAANVDDANRNETIHMFGNWIETPSTNDSIKYLSLLSLGELGRRRELEQIDGIQQSILALFGAQSEEVKFAAAFALGNISVGDINKHLPVILTQIKEQPKKRYLLLNSLKEVITRSNEGNKLQQVSTMIWEVLLESCDTEQEEGTRNVAAECLGKLALTDPKQYIPVLQAKLSEPSAYMRATVATAIKYTIADPTNEHDDLLRPTLSGLLPLLKDESLEVQRLALLTLNSAVHRKQSLVKDILGDMIPLLYQETVVKEELIHTVEMGPFKHKVDDGLEIRKAAFECLYALLGYFDSIDANDFLDRVRDGLNDQHDIKMLAYLMLGRLAKIVPNAIQQRLDEYAEPLKITLDFKMRSNAVKQEVEKNQELVRATLRCIVSLQGLEHSGSPKFNALSKDVRTGPLAEEYKKTMTEIDSREATRGTNDYMDLS